MFKTTPLPTSLPTFDAQTLSFIKKSHRSACAAWRQGGSIPDVGVGGGRGGSWQRLGHSALVLKKRLPFYLE